MRRSQVSALFLVLILGVGTLAYFTVIERNSWGKILKISSDTAMGARYPTITADKNTIYCAWEAPSAGNTDIYLRSLSFKSWSMIQKISHDYRNESQRNVQISVQDGEIHGVWASDRDELYGDYDIYYRHYNGMVWQPEILISEENFTEWQGYPVITVDMRSIHLAWVRAVNPWEVKGDEDIHYKYFDGVFWHPEQVIGTDISQPDDNSALPSLHGDMENVPQGWPAIAGGNGKIHIVWVERGAKDTDIFYTQYNGITWLPKMELSRDTNHEMQLDPAIAVNGDKVHVVWADSKGGDYDIVYRSYDGATWGNEKEISRDEVIELQQRPAIASIGNEVYVVWEEFRDGNAASICGRYFDGTFWHLVQKVRSATPGGTPTNPAIAATNATFHIVWMEDSGIYYRSFGSLTEEMVTLLRYAILGVVCVLVIYLQEIGFHRRLLKVKRKIDS